MCASTEAPSTHALKIVYFYFLIGRYTSSLKQNVYHGSVLSYPLKRRDVCMLTFKMNVITVLNMSYTIFGVLVR